MNVKGLRTFETYVNQQKSKRDLLEWSTCKFSLTKLRLIRLSPFVSLIQTKQIEWLRRAPTTIDKHPRRRVVDHREDGVGFQWRPRWHTSLCAGTVEETPGFWDRLQCAPTACGRDQNSRWHHGTKGMFSSFLKRITNETYFFYSIKKRGLIISVLICTTNSKTQKPL